jgi:preprotein translocase subunit YajC
MEKIITKSGIHSKLAETAEGNVVIETMAGKIKM